MPVVAQILVGVAAALHFGFLALEMFFWDQPAGRRIFGLKADFAARTKVLAANQGLYNGFLAAGLVWSLFPVGAPDAASAIATFFLACVIVAGIFGAATVSRSILYVQALPALVALALVWFS